MNKINKKVVITISVLEVNLNAIKQNVQFVKEKLNKNQKLCVVAKANAYGLGAKVICNALDDCSDYFAVSSAKEFYEIKSVVTKPVLILDPVYENVVSLIEAGAELTISNFESLETICKFAGVAKKMCKVHIVVNTGMNRFGFKTFHEFEKAVSILVKIKYISIVGVFSHFYEATNKISSRTQFKIFQEFQSFFKNKFSFYNQNVLFHLSNSDGVFNLNGFDMARVGMSIYTDVLFETVTLKSKIIDIQNLEKDEVAGYSALFKAKKNTKLAVVGIGYGDGIFRNIHKHGYVLISGKKARIVAVCMDSLMIDVTGLDVKVSDDVVLIGKSGSSQIFICDIADWCDTICYDIITRITSRVERKYIK